MGNHTLIFRNNFFIVTEHEFTETKKRKHFFKIALAPRVIVWENVITVEEIRKLFDAKASEKSSTDRWLFDNKDTAMAMVSWASIKWST
jgi:hypothetical protein